jgi:hypothetical protein
MEEDYSFVTYISPNGFRVMIRPYFLSEGTIMFQGEVSYNEVILIHVIGQESKQSTREELYKRLKEFSDGLDNIGIVIKHCRLTLPSES